MHLRLVSGDGSSAPELPRRSRTNREVSQRHQLAGSRVDGSVTVVVGRFDPIVAFGLAHLLRDSHHRVLAANLEDRALEREIAHSAPQVAILDAPAEPCLLEQLRSSQPATGLLVLAHQPTHAYGMAVLAAGASCISRNASSVEILAAVQLVADGGRVFVSADGGRVERCLPSLGRPLTGRELDVLELLSQGRKPPEIAAALQINVATVRTYTARIHQKLNVANNKELIGLPVPTRPRKPTVRQ